MIQRNPSIDKQKISLLLHGSPSGKELSLRDLSREFTTFLAIGLSGLTLGMQAIRQIDDNSRIAYDKAMTSTLSAMTRSSFGGKELGALSLKKTTPAPT